MIKLRIRWAGYVPRMAENLNSYGLLMGKSEGERLLGRPTITWEYNIKNGTYRNKMGRYELDSSGTG
jgi:hypothetical protein